MRIKKFLSIIVFFVCISLVSCDTKENYLNSFESFVEDIETNGDEYSKEDWEYCDEEYEAFVGDYMDRYSGQLTKEDYQQIGRLKARYHKAMIAHAVTQLGEAIDASSQIAAGYLEEMGDEDDLDDLSESLTEELSGIVDKIDE